MLATRLLLVSAPLALLLSGCATYVAPGRGADLADIAGISTGDIRAAYEKQPAARFPSVIAPVRVQAPGYKSYTLEARGAGAYSVITVREAEKEEDFVRMTHWPQIAGIAPLTRMLIPEALDGDRSLRVAAARVQADIVFIYTFDTVFRDRDLAPAVTLLSLGFSPHKNFTITTTVSSVLMDVRTGYIYGTSENTVSKKISSSAWASRDAMDRTRLANERACFAELVNQMEDAWPDIAQKYRAPKVAVTSAAASPPPAPLEDRVP